MELIKHTRGAVLNTSPLQRKLQRELLRIATNVAYYVAERLAALGGDISNGRK